MALIAKVYNANDFDSLKEAESANATYSIELHGDYTDETTNKDMDVLRAICFNSSVEIPVVVLEEAGTVLNIFHPLLKGSTPKIENAFKEMHSMLKHIANKGVMVQEINDIIRRMEQLL